MKDIWKQLVDTSPQARIEIARQMAVLARECREAGLDAEAQQCEDYIDLLQHGSDDEVAAVVMTAGVEEN